MKTLRNRHHESAVNQQNATSDGSDTASHTGTEGDEHRSRLTYAVTWLKMAVSCEIVILFIGLSDHALTLDSHEIKFRCVCCVGGFNANGIC